MGVPGVRVDDADHPVVRDCADDPPPPSRRLLRVVRVGDQLDVPPGDQRQQGDRVRLGCVGLLLTDAGHDGQGVADQGVDELTAGLRVVPGDLGLAGVVVVVRQQACSSS